MKSILKVLLEMKGNFSTKCKLCGSSVKKKDAYIETVKRLELVYPKPTAFCSKSCCENYKLYEKNAPKQRSLCSMCPTHPDA